jgi:integrase
MHSHTPLYIYRYHSDDCIVHKLGLEPTAKKFYRECDCAIWITGTADDKTYYPRTTTGLRDWAAAEAELRRLQAKGKDIEVHGPTIEDCAKRFLDAHAREVQSGAHRHHELTLERLQAYCKRLGKYHMSDLNYDLIEDFKTYGLSELKASTSLATSVSKLKVFLKEAYTRGWITVALHTTVKRVKAVYEKKQPYTEEEIALILDEAEKLKGGVSGYATNGPTFRLLLELMLESGLRVSDAVRFNPKHLSKSRHMWKYKFEMKKQKKNEPKKDHVIYLSLRLKAAIGQCKWFSVKLPFAYRDPNADEGKIEAAVLERMQEIGKRCGVDDCRPHRLRDTFAYRMLHFRKMGLEDVSHLLCHSSTAVTERYYSAWLVDRELRLERLFSEALSKPFSDETGDTPVRV